MQEYLSAPAGPQICVCKRNVGTCLCFPWQRLGGWAPASSPHAPVPARPAPSPSPPSPSWSWGRRTPAPCWPARCRCCHVGRSKESRCRTAPASWRTESGQRGTDRWMDGRVEKQGKRRADGLTAGSPPGQREGGRSPHRMCCAITVRAQICEHNMEPQRNALVAFLD